MWTTELRDFSRSGPPQPVRIVGLLCRVFTVAVIWGLFFKTAPFPSQVKYFFQHPLANFKVKTLIQKYINLRQ